VPEAWRPRRVNRPLGVAELAQITLQRVEEKGYMLSRDGKEPGAAVPAAVGGGLDRSVMEYIVRQTYLLRHIMILIGTLA
jgi:hypothetical protein